MKESSDLILIVEQDPDARAVLHAVAARIGCDIVEADTLEALREVLAVRRPTIAVVAIDHSGGNILNFIQVLAQHDSQPPATVLVGSVGASVMSTVKRAAQSRGSVIVGEARRPLDQNDIEKMLTPHLTSAPLLSRQEIEHAIEEHEFTLLYQPKLSIAAAGPSIHGVEALVRWQHPRRGVLLPRLFLGFVEAYDMMSRLTDFVMTEAVRQAGVWRNQGLNLELVVNLSPRLVQDQAFPERLSVLLQENDFPPQQLVLDVTEAPSAKDRELMLDVFTRLRILGIGLAIDNFGTGSSSLSDLYRMPFTEIKVDHSLIADVPREKEALLIVESIAKLAKALQLTVCAAGIETRQMMEFVRRAGFDTAQGNFFSPPVHAQQIEKIVQAWPGTGPAATGSWRSLRPLNTEATGISRRLPSHPLAEPTI